MGKRNRVAADLVEQENEASSTNKEEAIVVSSIQKERDRYEKQINEIQTGLESINTRDIKDQSEKLKMIDKKVDIMLKLPKLLLALKELNDSIESSSTRGTQKLSLIELDEI